jgi:4-amino-4-deoxy-L-arabinose transferase-like glycosyltransferase
MSLCLAAATAWYGWTAVQSLRHPLNGGADLLWAELFLFFGIAVLVSRALLGRVVERFLWRPALAAAAVAMCVLSHRVVAVLVTLWLLALAWALGDRLLGRMAAGSPGDPLERACIAVALGLALLAFLALALALLRQLTAGWAYGSLAALTLIQGLNLRNRRLGTSLRKGENFSTSGAGDPPERGVVLLLLGSVALVNLAWALAPEIQYDALNYQLAVPAVYAGQHRLVDLPVFWHSYFAHMVNMLFALAFALTGPAVAKLLVFSTGILAALATYGLGRSLWNERVGLWSAAIFYTVPLVGWLSSTAYVDLPVALFFLTSLAALLRWATTRHTGWLLASGLLAGAALGTKLTALTAAAALVAALLFFLARDAETPLPRKAGTLAAYLATLGLVAAPWYLIVLVFTGNPFFPLFNGIFRSPGWDPVNTNLNAGLFGIGTSPGSLVKLPFALTFRSGRFGEALPNGGAGLALALLPAAAVLAWRVFAGRRVLFLIAGCYLVLWAFNVQYARYYIPLLPVVCLVTVAAVSLLSLARPLRRFHVALAGLVLVAQVCLHSLQYWNIPDRVPVLFAFGRESEEAFLSRALGGVYDAVRHLNGVLRPGEKVVTGGADPMRFYLDAPLASFSETFELKKICGSLPPPQLAHSLTENGYTYLLVSGPIDPKRGEPFSTPEFLRRFTTLEFQYSSARVYRIHAGAAPE